MKAAAMVPATTRAPVKPPAPAAAKSATADRPSPALFGGHRLAVPVEAPERSIAFDGVRDATRVLPFLAPIQRAFGHHEIGHVRTAIGGEAATAARQFGARAFTIGNRIAFRSDPDLRLAAHEAAHVVQQRAGVQLAGGFGRRGDPYERHADAVADAVVRGATAQPLLDQFRGRGGGPAIQAKCGCDDEQVQFELDDAELAAQIESLQDQLEKAPPGKGEGAIKQLQQLNAIDQARHPRDADPAPMTPMMPDLSTTGGDPQGCVNCHTSAPKVSGFGIGPAPQRPTPVPNRAMEQGVASEKWDEGLEYNYKKLGDFRHAKMIRDCREYGAVACAYLMTVSEAWALFREAQRYARYVEDQKGQAWLRAQAKRLIRDGVGGFELAQVRAQPRPAPRPRPGPAPDPIPGPQPIVNPSGPIVMILAMYIIDALIDLANWTNYQQELHKLGFEVLDDPLAVCISGCHYPAPQPSPYPDPDPRIEPRPRPKPDPRRRRRPVPTLWLPAGKYRHAPLYESYVLARRLGADPLYDRPDIDQAENWRDEMDPRQGGMMVEPYYELGLDLVGERLGCDPRADRDCYRRARARVLLPTWDRAGNWREKPFPMFAVDHIIELQVGALLPIDLLDSMSNWELLEYRMNSSIGSQLYRNILYERARLTAIDPTGNWFDIVLVFEDVVLLGNATAPYWANLEVMLGNHIDVLKW